MADVFAVKKSGGIAVAEITKSEITMYEIDMVKKDFSGILEKDSKDVILNFKNLDFISSLVLAAMVYLLKLTKDKGGKLKLCELRDKVNEVFKVTDLDKVLEIYPTESEALKSFNE